MVGFEYCGNTTESIIGVPLLLVSTDGIQPLENTRNKIEGDQTISRQVTNEYGTINEPLQFSYSLIKSDFEPFTEEEQVAVQRWLTSPKLSSRLTITNCDGNKYSYYGLFTSTAWDIAQGDLSILTFTFQATNSYPYRYFEFTGTSGVYDGDRNLVSVNDSFVMDFNCQSDELNEYIYPVIEITALNLDYDSSFVLTNLTDGNNSVTLNTVRVTTMYLDCEHCILGEFARGVSSNVDLNLLRYKDIGWGDVGNIYWPRLIPGRNRIRIEGHVNAKIWFHAPFKKVGGWLI